MLARDSVHDVTIAYSSSRAKRPNRPVQSPFAPGNEHVTPAATLTLPDSANWKVRCFPNAFPVLSGKQGRHEVIVETDLPAQKWEDFSDQQLALVFSAYQRRFGALSRSNAKYVLLFKNFGEKSGASIAHEHSQIISFPFTPDAVAAELQAGDVPFKKLLREPALLDSVHFRAVCPPASRFAWETWILAKDANMRFEDMDAATSLELMRLLQHVIRKVKAFSPDYTVVWHAAPKGRVLRFHVEILPRKAVWGGIELGAGVMVNFKNPRDARRELATV